METTVTAKNPVTYAEDTLGVHHVWDEAQTRLREHDTAKGAYLAAHAAIRAAELLMADREAEIVNEERGKHPDMKITEFKLHVKTVSQTDPIYAEHEEIVHAQKAVKETMEQEMRHHELGVRAATARMTELGGLLEFYAASKRAATAAKRP